MGKNLTRRNFLRTFGIGAAAVTLAACQPKIVEVTKIVTEKEVVKETVEVEVEKVVEKEKVVKETVVVEKQIQAPEPKGRVEFWGHDQHPLDLAGEGFMKKYPDVTFESPHPAEYGQKLQVAMAAGSGCPDLIWAEATSAQEWGCQDVLTILDDWLIPVIDDYHPSKVAETYIAKTGHHIGWPGDISVSGFYYREDKFAEAGFPDVDWEAMTYDEFNEMSRKIGEKGLFTFCAPQGWTALFWYALHQVGGTGVSKDGQTLMMDTPEAIEAMKIVKNLYANGGGLDTGWWSAPYWAAVQEGKLIGDFAAAWVKGFWEAQIKTPDKGLGYWRIAKFPGGNGIKNRTGIWGGAQLVIPTCAENKENALLFMQYALGSLEGCALCGSWGIIPAYRPYLQSSLFLKLRSPVTGDFALNEFWAEQETELSPDFYRLAGWGAIDPTLTSVMPKIAKGEVTVEQGMQEIQQIALADFDRAKCKI